MVEKWTGLLGNECRGSCEHSYSRTSMNKNIISLYIFQTSIDVTTWLDPVDLSSVRREAMEEVYGPGHNEEGDFDDIYMYRIK